MLMHSESFAGRHLLVWVGILIVGDDKVINLDGIDLHLTTSQTYGLEIFYSRLDFDGCASGKSTSRKVKIQLDILLCDSVCCGRRQRHFHVHVQHYCRGCATSQAEIL